jgi:hypothetical protein
MINLLIVTDPREGGVDVEYKFMGIFGSLKYLWE